MEPRLHIERALIRAAFSGHEAVERIAAEIRSEDFTGPDTRAIWRVLHGLTERGEPLDPVTVAEELADASGMTRKLSIEVLVDLASAPWEAAHIEHYCETLRRYSATQSALEIANQMIRESVIDRQIVDGYIAKLDEVFSRNAHEVSTASQAVRSMVERKDKPRRFTPTGFLPIDLKLGGGLKDGQVLVIGGRPGAGKSVMLTQMAVNVARQGRPALIVSLEMLKEEITERIAATLATDQIERLPLFFIDSTSDLGAIVALIRVAVRRYGIRLVVVDYLQLCEVPFNRSDNRERQIATISRRLKRLALDLQIPICIGSQLNRESSKRAKPSLADLRESGAIEQDADIVVLLSRTEPDSNETLCEIAKHRGGGTGEMMLDLDGPSFQFLEREQEWV